MENIIVYVFCSVIVIPLLTKLIWSNKKIRKVIKKLYHKLRYKVGEKVKKDHKN